MGTVPRPGEVWFVDLGMVGKPRYALVLAAQADARLVKVTEFVRKAPGKFDARVISAVEAALKRWLKL